MDRAANPSSATDPERPPATETGTGTGTATRRALPRWVAGIEANPMLDQVATRLDGLAARVSRGRAGEVLRGEPLGHPLHPALTDLPIGFFTSVNVLDLLGGRGARTASRRLLALGLLSVPATAAAGLADYSTITDTKSRRVAAVHTVGNGAAALLYLASWRARGRHHHLRGKLLALAGAGVATGAGYLGGRLAFGDERGGGDDEDRGGDDPRLLTRTDTVELLTVPIPDSVPGEHRP